MKATSSTYNPFAPVNSNSATYSILQNKRSKVAGFASHGFRTNNKAK
jgi:hypothetical protein